MSEIFEKRNLNYNLRSQTDFSLNLVNTIAYGLKWPKYFAGKLWSIVPFEIRNAISIEEFSANQRTGFYMMGTSVMKELKLKINKILRIC